MAGSRTKLTVGVLVLNERVRTFGLSGWAVESRVSRQSGSDSWVPPYIPQIAHNQSFSWSGCKTRISVPRYPLRSISASLMASSPRTFACFQDNILEAEIQRSGIRV